MKVGFVPLQYVDFSPLEVAYLKQRRSLMMPSLSAESWEMSSSPHSQWKRIGTGLGQKSYSWMRLLTLLTSFTRLQ